MSSSSLKRAYQLLLRAYPAATRAERGNVELDTLLSVSRPDQRLPKVSEGRAIAKHGIVERVRDTAGESPVEVVAHGATYGVLFTMSMQLWWFALMSHKLLNSINALRGQETVHFVLWGAAVGLVALRWSFRPTRWLIGVWQLSNVVGGAWVFSLFKHHGSRSDQNLGNVVLVGVSIILLLALSSVVVLWCWSRLSTAAKHATIGWKAALFAIVVPIWASPLSPIDSSGLQVFGLAVIGMLLVGMVDPRPLIGLGIALLTPLVAASVAMTTSATFGCTARVLVPTFTLVATALVALRVRALLRRLPD